MIRQFFKRLFSSKQTNPNSHKARKPRIWKHAEHHIDVRLLSNNAVRVCETLQSKGYQAFVVGGAVRDLLLGIRPKDFDVATNAKPQEVQRLFRRARVIGRRFQIVHVMFGSDTIETSTFRAMHGTHNEVDEHGRVLRDNEFGRQDEDAARRDFTINAMYYNPKTQTVWDYHNGMQDLRAGLLRMIGDPPQRYREDPVRMLRVVRFQAKLRLKIEPATQAPIASMAGLLGNVPPSRLFDEMLKLLCSGSAMACLQSLRAAGLHHGVFPLLDVILDQPHTQQFIERALARTDARVHEGKPISPGFLFATLMWHLVQNRWQQRQNEGELKFPALYGAIEDVLHQQAERTAIPKRITGDMREIWAAQPRFEKRQGKSVFLFLEQPKFRAALDFLELRAESGEVESELAQWWRSFSDGDPNKRQDLLDNAQGHGPASANKRRRRKKRSTLCYLGLGGNLGQPQTLFNEVLEQFKAHPLCTAVLESPRFYSAPVEATGPDFINSVLQLHWLGSAQELLNTCMDMELAMGRVRQSDAATTERNAPRTLDIDVLLFGQETIHTPTLTVPHPRMHLRRFVLEPLMHLDPNLSIPGQGLVQKLWPETQTQALKPVN